MLPETNRLPLRPLLCGGVLLLAVGVCRADVEARIAQCAASATPAERIACLEQNLRELAGAAGPAPSPSSTPAAAASASLPQPAAPVGHAASPAPAGSAAEVRSPAPAAAAAGKPSAKRAPAKTPDAEAAPEAAAPGLGAEQVAARERSGDEAPAIVRARAVEFRFVGYRRLLARLDNGQVWRQLESDRVSVERGLRALDAFDVEMWEAPFGGYRMRILPLDRTIRVERLE